MSEEIMWGANGIANPTEGFRRSNRRFNSDDILRHQDINTIIDNTNHLDGHARATNNPHGVTAAQVGAMPNSVQNSIAWPNDFNNVTQTGVHHYWVTSRLEVGGVANFPDSSNLATHIGGILDVRHIGNGMLQELTVWEGIALNRMSNIRRFIRFCSNRNAPSTTDHWTQWRRVDNI